MTYEEARLVIMKYLPDDLWSKPNGKEAWEKMGAVFARQIPVVVKAVKRSEYFAPDYYCPNCGKQQKDSFKNKKKGCYCERCGQALKWEEV